MCIKNMSHESLVFGPLLTTYFETEINLRFLPFQLLPPPQPVVPLEAPLPPAEPEVRQPPVVVVAAEATTPWPLSTWATWRPT